MMDVLYDLCDNLKDEIRELNKKGDISPTELDRAFKAVDIIKDIKTIEAMEDAGEHYGRSHMSREQSRDGQSMRMPYPMYYYDEPGMGGHSEDGSYRRGRGGDGRYVSRDGSSRDGYSGHEEKQQMMRQIEDMKRKVEQM